LHTIFNYSQYQPKKHNNKPEPVQIIIKSRLEMTIERAKGTKHTNKLFGLQWQGAPSKDVSGEYWVRILRGTTLNQCACFYARTGLVAHHWWVRNRCESQKKKSRERPNQKSSHLWLGHSFNKGHEKWCYTSNIDNLKISYLYLVSVWRHVFLLQTTQIWISCKFILLLGTSTNCWKNGRMKWNYWEEETVERWGWV